MYSNIPFYWKLKYKKSDLLKNELFKDEYFSTGNEIKPLDRGDKKVLSILEEIKKAKKFIHIQSFIINGGITFDEIEKELIKKHNEGIEVRIITDYIGNLQTPNKTYKKLKEAGIEFKVWNPVHVPFITGVSNHRNHDKIIVVDNKVAFIGGINIGDDYSHMYEKYGLWNDLHFKIKGKLVDQLNRKFILNWYMVTNERLDTPAFRSNLKSLDKTKLILDFPYSANKNFLNDLITSINNAKHSIKLITPYLILPHNLHQALVEASSKGIIVNIIITGKADKKTAYIAGQYYAERLTSYGIKVMRTDGFFMHSKAYIIDDNITIIGTSNLDYRAIYHHFETNIATTSKKLNSELNDYFDNLARHSYLIENKSTDWNIFKVFVWWIVKFTSPMM